MLRTSREEVQGLKVVVQTLKNTSVTGASEEAARELEDERAKVREAQLHVHGLTQSFDELLSEMERLKQDTVAAVGTGNDAVRAPENLRPTSALGGPEPSFAVAVARVVLQGYSTQQAEGALREIGRNDAAAAVGHLRAQGARPEIDPPTAARLGFASRMDSPYPTGDVIFPKGRPHVAAGAAAWPGQVRPRPWRGDLFVARRRAADLLVTLTSAAYSTSCDTEDRAREACLAALTAQKVLANRPVPARLLLNAGALEHTAYALSSHRRDPDIVCSAAAVLRELTANHGSAGQCLQHPGDMAAACVAACAALKSNPGNIAVGIHCAALLWGLCTLGGAPIQNAAVRGGVQQYLLELLTCYPEHRELVWRITGALLAMAVRNGETQEALTAWGVQSAVRNALARDPTLTYGGEFSELRPWMKITGPSGPPPVETQEPELAKPGRQGRDGNPRGRRGGPSAPPAPPGKLSRGVVHGSAAWPSVADGGDDDDDDEEDYDEDEDGDFVAVQTRKGGVVVPPFKQGASSHVSSAARKGGISAQPPAHLTRNTAYDGASDARIMVAQPGAGAAPHSVAAARSVARSGMTGSDAHSLTHSDGLTAQLAATAPMRYVYVPGQAAAHPYQHSAAHGAADEAELAAVQRLLSQGPHGGAPGGAARSDVSRGSHHHPAAAAKPASSAVSGVSSREGAVRDATDTGDSYDEEYDEEEDEMEASVAMEHQPVSAHVPATAVSSLRPSRAASLGAPSAPGSVSAPPKADVRQAEAAATRERLRAEQAAAVQEAARAQAEEEHHRQVEEAERRQRQQLEEEAQLAAETERRRQAEEARRAAREAHLRSVIEAERKAIEAEERAAALERAAEAQARAAEAEERAAAAMAIDAERRERRAAAAAAMAAAQERAARATAAVNAERQRAAQLAAAAAEKAEEEESRARDEAARAEEKRRIAAEQAAEARSRAMARAEEAAIRERQRQAAANARAAAAAVEKAQGISAAEPVLEQPVDRYVQPAQQQEPEPVVVPMPEDSPARSGEAVDRALGLLALPSASPESVSSALRTLTAACGTGKAAYVVASGGLSLVVGAMRRHVDNPAVLADACLVLGVVTHESDAAQGALSQSPCSDGEAVSAVCSALYAFPKVAALQATAAWALWGVVRGSASNAKRAVVSKAPAALVAAIGNNVESAEVGQSASGALLAIAAASDVGQEAVANARGVSAVKAAMKRHASIKFRGEFDGLREWLKMEGKRG